MNSLIPNPINVNTQEYWGNISPLPKALMPHGILERYLPMTRHTTRQVGRFCGEAALSIFRGETGEAAPPGTSLHPQADNAFTQPGTVLLVDIEAAGLALSPYRLMKELDKPPHKSLYMGPKDLAIAPAVLYRNNARPSLTQGAKKAVVFPYRKHMPPVLFPIAYTRAIGLLAFAEGRDGKMHSVLDFPYDTGKVILGGGSRPLRLGTIGDITGLSVGDTYDLAERSWTGKPARLFKEHGLIRLRSATIHSQGVMDTSKKKVKSKIVVPRLRSVPTRG